MNDAAPHAPSPAAAGAADGPGTNLVMYYFQISGINFDLLSSSANNALRVAFQDALIYMFVQSVGANIGLEDVTVLLSAGQKSCAEGVKVKVIIEAPNSVMAQQIMSDLPAVPTNMYHTVLDSIPNLGAAAYGGSEAVAAGSIMVCEKGAPEVVHNRAVGGDAAKHDELVKTEGVTVHGAGNNVKSQDETAEYERSGLSPPHGGGGGAVDGAGNENTNKEDAGGNQTAGAGEDGGAGGAGAHESTPSKEADDKKNVDVKPQDQNHPYLGWNKNSDFKSEAPRFAALQGLTAALLAACLL